MIKKLQHLTKKFIDLVITETIIASDRELKQVQEIIIADDRLRDKVVSTTRT